MTVGANYLGSTALGGNTGTGQPFAVIRPAVIPSTATFYEATFTNEYLAIWPFLFNSTQFYEPTIYGQLQIIGTDEWPKSTNVFKPRITGELAPNDTAPEYEFYRRTFLPIRDITAGVQVSFIKGYDPDAAFFTVGVSAFDGGDVFQGDGSTIQEWDKFQYTDYSDYLRSFTYHYEQDVLGSMALGYADITLTNTADTFSPYGDSPIADLILPWRPLKLYTGYKQRPYQVFVGQTTRLPKANQSTAEFHALDFIASFAGTEITSGRIYTDVTTDEVLDDILQNDANLSPTQYELDTGLNTINFLHVEPGKKIGDLFRELIEAEQGRLYQRYNGEIVFRNRNNKLRPTALELHNDWVYVEKEPDQGNVINRVKINADVREVQPSQQIHPALKDGSLTEYEDFSSIKIKPGETVEKFFDFADPVTSIVNPVVGGGVTANSAQDGTGTNRNADLGFAVVAAFTNSVKYSFTNNGATDLYVTQVTITGTPAKVVREIRIDEYDTASIEKYGEQLVELNNDFFTDRAYAESLATSIIDNNKDAPSVREITIKGVPYANVGDVITYYDGLTYVIDKLSGKVSPGNGHTQDMILRRVDIP